MKKKMFIAGMSLAIALVLLATASFAWFTISTQPEVSGMNMALYSDRTLLLASGDGTDTAPDSDDFNQYISLSSDFAGLAPLRPVSTADGINWFLPAYDTASGTLSEVGNFILDDSLEHANVSVVDASGQPLTGDALLAAQSRGYYVYTDIWMKTEEDGAKVRLSVPHSVGTTEERHAGTVTEYGLDAEELTKAVYGTYVLGEPELDENDSHKLKVRTEEPETALRVGFLIYQDSETLEPIAEDSDAALCFKIFEPNANKRAAGLSQDLWIPGKDGSTTVTREQYIAGSTVSTLQSNTYYVTQPIAKSENGQITLTTVPVENMIVQLSSEWDESAVLKTMNGLWGNSIKKPSSNDVKTFGQFIKLNDAFATANNEIDLSDTTDITDIAGNNLVVELKKDTPIRVRLFVWLEGQDVDCWNDIATGTFRINLELAGESVVKSGDEEEPAGVCTLRNDWLTMAEAGINKNSVKSIEFTTNAPASWSKKWNAGTQDGRNAIYAYEQQGRIYVVVPSGQDKICFPEDSSYLFSRLENCKSITGFEYVDTSNVTNMYDMFAVCSSLTSLDLSGFNTENVITMTRMFWYTGQLKTLDISSFKTPNLVHTGGMFYYSGVQELDMSGFDTSKMNGLGNVFGTCTKLRTIYVGEGWKQNVGSIDVFGNCYSLVGGNGTKYDPAHKDASYARIDKPGQPGYFTDKNAPKTVTCTLKGYGTDGNSSDGWFDSTAAGARRSAITALEFTKTVPTGYTTTWNAGTGTGDDAINAYLVGTKVYIVVPDGADKIMLPADSSDLFGHMIPLGTIDGLDLVDTSGVTDMSGMFSYIDDVRVLDLSSWDTSNVTDMSGMFEVAMWLETVYVGDKWSTESVPDNQILFQGNRKLVGGNGTPYNGSYVDKTYARIDKPGQPGYFTKKLAVLKGYGTSYGNGSDSWNNRAESGISRDQITSIVFTDTVPTGYTKTWNAGTSTGAAAINAYLTGTTVSIVLPEGEDKIALPENSNKLFYSMTNCRTISGLEYVDTSSVTDMGSMFSDCGKLNSLDVSNFDTTAVTNMNSMFCNCSSLTSLDVSSFETSAVTDMSWMFRICSLTSLDVTSFDTSAVTNMRGMFYGCSNLKTILVGSGFTTSAVTDSLNMFRDCSALVGGDGTTYSSSYVDKTYARIDGGTASPGYFTRVAVVIGTLKGYGTDGYSSDGWFNSTAAGIGRNQITALEFVKSVPTGYTATWNAGTGTGDEAVNAYLTGTKVSIVLPNGADKVALPVNSQSIFSKMTACTSISGTRYLDTSSVTNMNKMFYWCTNLASLDVSRFDTSAVTDMSEMFGNGPNLIHLDVSNFNTSSVRNMREMFWGCSKLVTLDVSRFDTSAVTNMSRMFSICSNLSYLDLSSFNTSAVTDMSGMFYYDSYLRDLDLSSFDTSKVSNMTEMFYVCGRLRTIYAGAGFTTFNVTTSSDMFTGCGTLVGGNGTPFNGSLVDKTFARIDTEATPGYFTAK